MNQKIKWHEKTPQERDAIIKERGLKTIGDVMANFDQPDWCDYPEALSGPMGCWSLLDPSITIMRDYCKDCECFNQPKL